MTARVVAAGLLAALAGSLLAAPTGRAGEVEGRVTDGAGRPVGNADVVISSPDGSQRRTDVTDPDGRFFLRVPEPGPRRVAIYSERGARVAALLLDVPAEGRVWVEAGGFGARAGITGVPPAAGIPGPSGGIVRSLARGDDLGGALLVVPGAAPPAAPIDGPVLVGTDPAETQVRLDGFLLNDPVDGRAPWGLPPALFAAVSPVFGLGPAGARQSGQAAVVLASPRPERPLEARLALAGGVAAPAGEAQGAERPTGWSGTGSAQARIGGVRPGGWLRGHLALAPVLGAFEADPQSPSAMRGRQPRRLPWVARSELDFPGWNLAAVGVGSFDRWRYGRTARIAPPRDPASESRDFWLVGATARRTAARGPGELVFRASLLRSGREVDFQGDAPARTTAHRGTVDLDASTDGRLLGWHLLQLSTGLDATWASRPGPAPSRQAGLILERAEGSSVAPWVALDERYRPLPAIEVELGVRLEKQMFRGTVAAQAQPPLERSFASGLLIAPRAQACYLGEAQVGRLCLTAGRFGATLPLHVLLDATAAPPAAVAAPAEDAALVTGEIRLGAAHLAFHALDRRTAHLLEDRFSPATGRLELFAPPRFRRHMQAVAARAAVALGGTRVEAGLQASRLRGDHVGFLDAGTGQARPAGTAGWDTLTSSINQDGPLPFDRPLSARVVLEHERPLGGNRLSVLILGRWDTGTPLSALGRSPESGPGQVFLVQRGSLGRTASAAGVDLRLGLARVVAGSRVSLALEGFNLTNFRPVVARDQIFTDAAVPAREGAAGRAGLAGLVDGQGNPVPARPTFGNPVAWAEPFLVRLGLAVEM